MTPSPMIRPSEQECPALDSSTSRARHILIGMAALLFAIAVTGCGVLRGAPDPTTEPSPPSAESMDPSNGSTATDSAVGDPSESEAAEPTDELLAMVIEGESALIEGELALAIEAFQGYLAFGQRDERSARAMWGLAMALLVPDTELRDAERAQRILGSLAEEYPGTIQGRQALWLHETLTELERARAVATEQAELIERLSEMVEQLRRIDLNRRPTGVRPDSLRSR